MAAPYDNKKNVPTYRPSPVPAHLLSQLERQLKSEIELQTKYAEALEEEGRIVKKFRKDDIDGLVESRSVIAEKVEAAAQQRETLRQQIDPTNSLTITQIVNQRVPKSDRSRLLKLISTLRESVERNQTRGLELGRLVQFTQTLVDGSIAILRSAAQPVTRSYGRNRVTVEREAPKTRSGMKITEA